MNFLSQFFSPVYTLAEDEFIYVSFESDRAFQLERFQTFISNQLPENVFRGKGLLILIF